MGTGTVNRAEVPRGRKAGESRLTELDIKVLRQIAKEGFQTSAELRGGVLQNVSRVHCWRLPKRLVKLGFLTECRGDGGGIRGWALSVIGQTKLRPLFDEDWRADRRPPMYRTSFDHDVALREMKSILIASPMVSRWTPEHVLRADVMRRIKYLGARDKSAKLLTVPDGLFHVDAGGTDFKAALELELTQKSKKRLYQKLEAHIISADFDFVFFIVSGETLQRLLWTVYQTVIATSVRVKLKDQQNGIYFTTLENIRRDRLRVKFAGLNSTFSFQQ